MIINQLAQESATLTKAKNYLTFLFVLYHCLLLRFVQIIASPDFYFAQFDLHLMPYDLNIKGKKSFRNP